MRFSTNGVRRAAIPVLGSLMLTGLVIASALYIDNLHSANAAQRMMSDAARLQINRSRLANRPA
jgi:hypothetical protein